MNGGGREGTRLGGSQKKTHTHTLGKRRWYTLGAGLFFFFFFFFFCVKDSKILWTLTGGEKEVETLRSESMRKNITKQLWRLVIVVRISLVIISMEYIFRSEAAVR